MALNKQQREMNAAASKDFSSDMSPIRNALAYQPDERNIAPPLTESQAKFSDSVPSGNSFAPFYLASGNGIVQAPIYSNPTKNSDRPGQYDAVYWQKSPFGNDSSVVGTPWRHNSCDPRVAPAVNPEKEPMLSAPNQGLMPNSPGVVNFLPIPPSLADPPRFNAHHENTNNKLFTNFI